MRLLRLDAYPDLIEVGLRVARLGNSSVQYELAIFREGEQEACAAGRFVHVFVERASNRPTAIPSAPARRAGGLELIRSAQLKP